MESVLAALLAPFLRVEINSDHKQIRSVLEVEQHWIVKVKSESKRSLVSQKQANGNDVCVTSIDFSVNHLIGRTHDHDVAACSN